MNSGTATELRLWTGGDGVPSNHPSQSVICQSSVSLVSPVSVSHQCQSVSPVSVIYVTSVGLPCHLCHWCQSSVSPVSVVCVTSVSRLCHQCQSASGIGVNWLPAGFCRQSDLLNPAVVRLITMRLCRVRTSSTPLFPLPVVTSDRCLLRRTPCLLSYTLSSHRARFGCCGLLPVVRLTFIFDVVLRLMCIGLEAASRALRLGIIGGHMDCDVDYLLSAIFISLL